MAFLFLVYIPVEVTESDEDNDHESQNGTKPTDKDIATTEISNTKSNANSSTEERTDIIEDTTSVNRNNANDEMDKPLTEPDRLISDSQIDEAGEDIREGLTRTDEELQMGSAETPLLAQDAESETAEKLDQISKVHVEFHNKGDDDEVEVTTECVTLEQFLQHVLNSLQIKSDVWTTTDNNNLWQVTFVVENEDCEKVLQRLKVTGFGKFPDTSISLLPLSCHYANHQTDNAAAETINEQDVEAEERNEFLSSITSRLTVAQVVEDVRSNATFTFDYVLLIILASLIAATGLAENSSVVLVASMLVSPLMGPIMGGTFGVVIENPDLWRLGVRNELIGLAICLISGFVFGLFASGINSNGAVFGTEHAWPTSEMQVRGLWRSLWVGILIALPSGAGVALSILGGNVGSLVGVAISASLLPPAVNAGMLWACSIIAAIHGPVTGLYYTDTTKSPGNHTPGTHGLHCGPFPDGNTYQPVHSCSLATEAAILAAISLALTLLNIICIFFTGILVLKIKEVTPDNVPESNASFWKKDIKVARSHKTIKTTDTPSELASVARNIAHEWKEKHGTGDAMLQSARRSYHNLIEAITDDPLCGMDGLRHRKKCELLLRQMSEVIGRDHVDPDISQHYFTLSPRHMMAAWHRRTVTSPNAVTRSASPDDANRVFNFDPIARHLRRNYFTRAPRGIKRTKPTANTPSRFKVTKLKESDVNTNQLANDPMESQAVSGCQSASQLAAGDAPIMELAHSISKTSFV